MDDREVSSRPRAWVGPAIGVTSTLAAAVLGWAVLRGRDAAPPTVELVDGAAGIEEAFRERDAVEDWRRIPGGIPRLHLGPKVAVKLFPSIGGSQQYHPRMLARHMPDLKLRRRMPEHPRKGWWFTTNSAGLREDTEVAAEKPDLRVLVVGDSHTDGVCDNKDSFANLLEADLGASYPERSIDVLNGGTGGWSFYNYLGALEGRAELAPDVFVVTVYGGNDFYDALYLHSYHRGEEPVISNRERVASLVSLARESPGLPAQWCNQIAFFHDHPETEATALSMSLAVTGEIARQCAERGTELLVVYLPPYASGQPGRFAESLALAREHLGLALEGPYVDDRLADGLLAGLAERGVRTVDLRGPIRAADEALYWETDHHINLRGQALVARELKEILVELGGLGG